MASEPSEEKKTASPGDPVDEETSEAMLGNSSSQQASDDLGAFGRGLGRSVDSVAEEDEDTNAFRDSQVNERTDTYSIFPTIEDDDTPIDIPAENLVPVDDDWPTDDQVDTREFVDPPKTPAHGLAAPSADDMKHATLSRETLRWLDAWAARDGAYIVEIASPRLQDPLKLVIVDGRLCFGMQIGKVPFLDVALKRRAPELVSRLVELYQNRDDSDGWPLDSLVGIDEIDLTEQDRSAMMQLMVRTLLHAAPFEDHAVSVEKVDIPDDRAPLGFGPLELALTNRPKNDVAIGPLLDRIPEQIQARAVEHWYFAADSDQHPLDALVASSIPGTCRLRDAFAAHDLGRRLITAAHKTDKAGLDMVSGIGMDDHLCWFAASDGQVMLVYSFEKTNIGLICRTARELSASREQVRASN